LLNDIKRLDGCPGNPRQRQIAVRAAADLLLAWSGPWQAGKEVISGENARGEARLPGLRRRHREAYQPRCLMRRKTWLPRQWRMKRAGVANQGMTNVVPVRHDCAYLIARLAIAGATCRCHAVMQC
jgi:hypothetical protein